MFLVVLWLFIDAYSSIFISPCTYESEIEMKNMFCQWIVIMVIGISLASCGTVSPSADPVPTTEVSLSYPAPTQHVFAYPVPLPTSTAVPMAQQSNDFAFQFSYGACGTDILDTFTGTYTKDMLIAPSITIPLTLSRDEMSHIYSEMQRINLFSYPSTYMIVPQPDQEVGLVSPPTSYSFVIRNAHVTHHVQWLDHIIEPTTPEAEQLRSLIHLIMTIIERQPAVQQLPVPQAACA